MTGKILLILNLTKHALFTKSIMMANKLVLILLGLFLVTALPAQKKLSWRKQAKLADELMEKGNLAEAAKNYEEAYKKKTKKEELIFKAGEAYYTLRNYRKAVEAYSYVKDKNDDFPLVGLKYARSLKRDSRYDKAVDAFEQFRKTYTGKGKAILEEIVQKEIEGCQLGKQLLAQGPPDLELTHLSSAVNTDDNEFAPISFSNEVLYYSSTMGGRARIYRTQEVNEDWVKGTIPENFPVIQNENFCHGTLSADGQRFYFTICNDDQGFNNLTSRCEIFVIRKVGNAWSQPEALPDRINSAGVTSTHPFVIQQGTQEILYFVSNRAGGKGGLDIWFSTRSMTGTDNQFNDPVNLGPVINTIGDEITPFFDPSEQALYFASNGHLSIGGFDVVKSRGYGNSWAAPENMGLPYNSSADDYYLYKDVNSGTSFVSSNRAFPTEKLNTLNDDIFRIGSKPKQLFLTGNVFDAATNAPLSEIAVSLYQINADNTDVLLFNRSFPTGAYQFDLVPNRRFRVEIERAGYEPTSYQIVTSDPEKTTYGQPVYLTPDVPEEVVTRPEVTEPEVTKPPVEEEKEEAVTDNTPITDQEVEYTARGLAASDRLEYRSSAPRFNGTYYKVQMVSLRKYDPGKSIFDKVIGFGDIETEYLIEKNLTRVLLARYFSADEAKQALQNVKNNGFPSAFVVRYDDGQRFGRVNLK
jgi:peptidoglycan-associated lipoprotein